MASHKMEFAERKSKSENNFSDIYENQRSSGNWPETLVFFRAK